MATLNANPIVYHQKAPLAPSKRKVFGHIQSKAAQIDEEIAEPWTADEVFGQTQHHREMKSAN